MRWNGFVGSLLFGAVAALLYQPFWSAAAPLLSDRAAASMFTTLIAAAYAAGSTCDLRRGLRAALLLGAVLSVASFFAPSAAFVVMLALLGTGFVRSALLYTQPFGRAVLIELCLLFGSAGIAYHLVAPGPLGGATAVWGVFLVQSTYYLVSATETLPQRDFARDPFEVAYQRAQELLES